MHRHAQLFMLYQIRLSVFLFVRPSHARIVSTPMNMRFSPMLFMLFIARTVMARGYAYDKIEYVSVRTYLLKNRIRQGPFIATQLNSTSSWVELRRRSVYSDATQLNWTQLNVELSWVELRLYKRAFSVPTYLWKNRIRVWYVSYANLNSPRNVTSENM